MAQTATIADIREHDTALAIPALQVLWPRYSDEEMLAFIDGTLRPNGYKLVGTTPHGNAHAASVLGYRLQHSLWLDQNAALTALAARVAGWRARLSALGSRAVFGPGCACCG